MNQLLLIEDSSDCFDMVQATLKSDFDIVWKKSVSNAIKWLEFNTPCMMLLDLMLPDGAGYDVLTFLQKRENVDRLPVLVLTAKSDLSDKILGFTLGADDYLCKPFEPLELKMRVLARLKSEKNSHEIIYKSLKVDISNMEFRVFVNNEWQKIELTGTEYKMLKAFISHPESMISRDRLLDRVWGEEIHLFPRIVDTYVSRLRKKLEDTRLTIRSKNRMGYALVESR